LNECAYLSTRENASVISFEIPSLLPECIVLVPKIVAIGLFAGHVVNKHLDRENPAKAR
jgi:hypothetical protein